MHVKPLWIWRLSIKQEVHTPATLRQYLVRGCYYRIINKCQIPQSLEPPAKDNVEARCCSTHCSLMSHFLKHQSFLRGRGRTPGLSVRFSYDEMSTASYYE